MANILVYVELVDDAASWASLLTLRQARYLATHVGATIYAVLPCATPPMYGENDIIAILSRQGADKVILMTHGDLSKPTLFQSHGKALITAATQFPPAMLMVPDGPAAVEIAPRVAAHLGGLFVRHPDLSIQDGSRVRIDQPLFEDTYVQRFDSDDLEHSVVAVVAPDPQQFSRPLGSEEAEVVVISPGFAEEGILKNHVVSDAAPSRGRPQRMVLVGSGVTTAEEVDRIRHLAKLMKAELRITEAAAKNGLLEAPGLEDPSLVCHPELLLALGVRGNPETLALVAKTTYLVGVNPDAEAPLFQRAQLGLVAPILEAVGQLVTGIESQPDEPLLPATPDEPAPAPAPASEAEAEAEAEETKESDALRDTLPPGTEAADSRTSAPTEEMETAEAEADTDAVTRSRAPTPPPEGGSPDGAAEVQTGDTDVGPGPVKGRPIDQLAHTPPMGTPLGLELKKALANAIKPTPSSDPEPEGAPEADETAGDEAKATPTGEPPAPSDPVTDKTPEASPAGVVVQAQDPALDDTVPAPLPGADGKPTADPASKNGDDGEPKP